MSFPDNSERPAVFPYGGNPQETPSFDAVIQITDHSSFVEQNYNDIHSEGDSCHMAPKSEPSSLQRQQNIPMLMSEAGENFYCRALTIESFDHIL